MSACPAGLARLLLSVVPYHGKNMQCANAHIPFIKVERYIGNTEGKA